MPNPLARHTINEIESAIADEKSTAINEIVQIIQQLAGKAFSISIEDLSDLISRDPTITEKVISSANTLGFNPNGLQIGTISEAIHTIGFEKIRNLAISLMLAENAGENANTFEQRNIAALCVCSGMLAQQLNRRPNASANSELLFVCASLRSYGKLLLSAFMVEQYRLAIAYSTEMPEDDAFRKVFGLTPLGLGRRVLRNTNLPKNIMYSLREITKETLSRPLANSEDEILAVSELAVNVCTVAFDERIGPAQFNDALTQEISRFGICYPTSLETVNQALMQVDEDISALNWAVGLSEKDSPATAKLKARLNGDFLPAPPSSAKLPVIAAKKKYEDMTADEREAFADATYSKVSSAIEKSLIPGERVSLAEIFGSVAHAFREAAKLENCLIFVREEFDQESLSARYGEGPLFEKVKNRPVVSPQKGDIFSICLARREDILIQDTQAGKIRSVIPDWIHSAGDTSSFIILPVNFDSKLFAIIVGTVSNEQHIDLKEGDLRNLRSIRAQLGTMRGMIKAHKIKAV